MLTTHTSIKNLSMQFAKFFNEKDVDGIGTLLLDHFALYDPALKWIRGKENVLKVLRKQFQETERVTYEVINAYEEGTIGILEFQITLDQLTLFGVDFMRWENEKMSELRCYYNPPQNQELKPFSATAKSFVAGEIYEHYKGKRYQIVSIGRHSETLEESVIYQAVDGTKDVWIRPLKMFVETIEIDGNRQPRFKRV